MQWHRLMLVLALDVLCRLQWHWLSRVLVLCLLCRHFRDNRFVAIST